MASIPLCKMKFRPSYYHNMPVWSSEDESILEAIENASKEFGLETVSINDYQVQMQGKKLGRGAVGVFNSSLLLEAQMYSHLTNRQLVQVDSFESLIKFKNIEIIILLYRDIDYFFIKKLYESKYFSLSMPGIIFGQDNLDLQFNVLIKSLLYWCPAILDNNYFRLNFLPGMRPQENLGVALDADILPYSTSLRKQLNISKNLLVINTHSDGIDADFNPLVLCPLTTNPKSTKKDYNSYKPEPSCVVNNYCYRLKLPLTDAILDNRRLLASELAAKIFVYATCNGVLLNSYTVDRKWHVAPQIFQNPRIGVFVTTWKSTAFEADTITLLENQLKTGRPLGKVIARFNRLPSLNKLDTSFLLFGDPMVRFVRQLERFEKKARPRVTKIELPDIQTLHNLWILENILQIFVNRIENKTLSQKASFCLGKIQSIKLAISMRIETEPSEFEILEWSILDFIFASGAKPRVDWMPLFEPVRMVVEHEECFHCKESSSYFIWQNSIFTDVKRKILNCPNCGIVNDYSIDYEGLKFQLLGSRRIKIVKSKMELDTASKFLLAFMYPEQKYNQCFPLDNFTNGELLATLPSKIHRKGIVHIAVMRLNNFQFEVIRASTRAEHI